LADRLRLLYGTEGLPARVLTPAAAPARQLWEQRRVILERSGGDEQLRADLLDLAIFCADLRVRLAPPGDAAARREALRTLAEAEELLGPGPVLCREQEVYSGAACASAKPPQTGWEHASVGRSFLRAGDFKRAMEELERALALEPQDFWTNFYHGTCAYHFGRYQEAVLAFSVCVGAAPGNAACFHNRALALTALGRTREALADYDRALRLEPGLAAATRNRGMLHYQEGRHAAALAGLQPALTRPPRPPTR